jgi:hypothetical protein
MLQFLIAILLPLSSGTAAATDVPPGFASLPKALVFISDCIEAKDEPRLESATLNGNHCGFGGLEAANRQIPFTKRYSGKAFPTLGTSFSVGGHDKRDDFIKIEFQKRGNLWYIDRIRQYK